MCYVVWCEVHIHSFTMAATAKAPSSNDPLTTTVGEEWGGGLCREGRGWNGEDDYVVREEDGMGRRIMWVVNGENDIWGRNGEEDMVGK